MSLIRVKEVEAENFMSIESAKFNFENRGLVLVEGFNGAGKSSLFVETLGVGLFGISERYGTKRNDIINRFANKNCYLRVNLDIDGVDVDVKTYRKHHRYKDEVFLFINGEDKRGNTSEHTRAKIERMLDMDYTTFTNSVVFGQAMSKYFSNLPDSEQKVIAERLLGITWISQAYELVKGDKTKIEEETRGHEFSIQNCQSKISDNETKRKEFMFRLSVFDEDCKKEITRYEHLIDSEKIIDTSELEASLKEIGSRIDGYKESLKGKTPLFKEMKELEKNISALEAEQKINRKNLDIIGGKIERADNFEGNETCEYCGRPITLEYLNEYKEHLVSDYQEAEKIYKQVEGDLITLRKSHYNLIPKENEFEEIESKKFKEETNYEMKSKKINEIKIENAKINERIKSYRSKIEELEHAVSPLKKVVEDLDLENSNLSKKIEIEQNFLVNLNEELCYNKFWEEGFSNRGLKSFIIESVTPQLNQSAKMYSRALGGNFDIAFNTQRALKSGEMREKFNVEVFNKFGSLTYEGNSNGERRLIDAIVMFVLGDLAASRSNKRFSILILDDVFEKLDESICESIINVLRAMTSDTEIGEEFSDLPKRESIFVLTHLDYFKSKFMNKIRVEKMNGKTTWREA